MRKAKHLRRIFWIRNARKGFSNTIFFIKKKLRRLGRLSTKAARYAKSVLGAIKLPSNILRRAAAASLAFVIVFSTVFYFFAPTKVLGQTYTLTQNDWSGGTSSSTVAAPSNLTGHSQYASGSGVTAGAGSVALTQSSASVSDSFTATTNRDTANTTAVWSGSGQVSAQQYAASNLTSALNSAGINNFDLRGVAVDPVSGVAYFGYTKNSGAAKLLGKYDPATGTATDLTATISGFIGSNSVSSMVVDNGKLYFVGWYNNFAVYDPATGLSTDLRAAAGIGDYDYANSLTVDRVRHKVYYGTSSGKLISFDTVTATGTNLTVTSGLSAFWSTGIAVADVDPSNGKLYMVGSGGEFAVYDPSNGVATDLSGATGHSTAWGSIAPSQLVYSQVDSKVYMLGWNGSYVPIFTAYSPVAGTETNITSTSGILGKDGAGQNNAMAYDSANGIIYIGSYWGSIYTYTPGVAGSIVVLDDTVSGLSSIDSNVSVGGLAVDSSHGRLFIANYNSVLGQLSIPPSSSVAASLGLDSTDQNIASATLTKNDTPGAGTVQYQLSADGGAHWETVTPGSQHVFSNLGSDLRFKIALTGNATVQDVSITYNYYPAAGELVSSKFDGQDPTTVVNRLAWNENASLPSGTSVVASLRTAATAVGLDSAPWINLQNGKPASTPSSVSESFAATTNRDSDNTTASWSGSGQVSASGYVPTDLTAVAQAAGVPSTIPSIVWSQSENALYFTSYNDTFYRYDIATNTITDLTVSSGLPTIWGANEYDAARLVMLDGKIYLSSGYYGFAVYDPATGDATDLTVSSGINAIGASYWPTVANGKIYMGTYYGKFMVFDPATGLATNITASSGLNAFWPTGYENTPRAIYDEVHGKLYLRDSQNASFAVLDVATGLATNLAVSSGLSSFWTSSYISGLAYSPVANKVYLAGDGAFAAYDPVTGTATNLTTSSGYGTFNTWNAMYDSTNDKVYLTSSNNYFLVYTPGNPGSVEDLTSILNPVLGYNHVYGMAIDATRNILYFGETSGVFGKMNLACASCRAVSVALDATSQNILSATLTKNDTPGTGTVAYELSNDGGAHWEGVTPGALHVFSSTGSDLRFRIVISGNATVQDVSMTYYSAIAGSANCTKVSATVTCGETTVPSSFQDGSNDRFFQYKLTLISDGTATPTIASVDAQFVVNAPPEVRNVTASQSSNGTVAIGYEVRDPDTAGGSPGNVGYVTPSFEYWDGSAWRAASTFVAGDTDRKVVEMDGTTWRSYTASWGASTDFGNRYLPGTVKVRVTVNDGEGANPTGSAESAVFGLDTKVPTNSALVGVAVESGPWSGAFSGTTAPSETITTSGASFILVGVAAAGSADEHVVSVSGPGLTFTKLAGGSIPDYTSHNAEYWGAFSSSALSDAVITATLSSSANVGLAVISLSGVSQSNPVVATVGPTTKTGDLSVTFGSTSEGSMVFAAAFSRDYDWNALAAGAGTTLYAHTNVAQFIRSTNYVPGGSYTISSTGWDAGTIAEYAAVEIRSATGGSPTVTLDASGASPVVNLMAADDSPLYMKVSKTDPTLASTDSEPYAATKSMTLASGETVYARFIDAYANASSILSATTPITPASVIIQDVSNLTLSPAQFQLFLAWKAASGGGFGSYQVYRSANQAAAYPWTLIATISQQNTNYYLDQGLSEGSTYYYYVVNVDSSGNRSNRSSVVYGTANGTQDGGEGGGGTANPPVITNVASSALSTSATVSWDTDTLSSSTVRYSTSPSVFTSSAAVGSLVNNASGVGRHEVILSGLAPNTTYYYEVQSTDTAEQTTTDANGGAGYSFTTAQGPVISNTTVVSVTNNTAKISWNTDILSTTQAVYSIHSDLSAPTVTSGTSDPTLHHEVTIGNLSPNTRYYFYVRSVDALSNETVDANIVDGQVLYYSLNTTNDQQAPTVSAVSASTRTDSADIVWTTDELADSQVDYGLTNAYGSTSNLDSAMTLRHIVTLSGLDPATTYYYRVRSRDVNGNLATGSDMSFTTPQSDDVTPPVISAVGVTGISLTGATVNWTTDEAATSFVEYGTTTSLGQGTGDVATRATGHAVSLSQLTPNQQYYFKVHSEDAAGNAATDDNSGALYTFTTAADTTPPVISSVGTVLVSDTSAVITWLTDEPAGSTINYGPDTGYGQQTSSSTGPSTSHSVTVTGLTKQTAYRYRVVSADPSGNSATDDNGGAGYSFTTTDAPGQIVSGGRGPTRDTDPPSILNLQVGSIGKTSASVTWTTSEAASTILKFGTTIAYGSLAGSIDEQLSAHQVSLSGLKPGTVYHFIAVSIDPSGNQGSSQDRQFATLNEDGTTVPLPPQPEPEQPTNANVPANANTPAEEAPEIEPSAKIIGVLSDLLKNPDLSNIPEQPFVNTVNEIIERVVRPPVIVGMAPKIEVTGTSATISWTTDKKSSGSVAFAPDAGFSPSQAEPYLSLVANPGELSTVHEVQLVNLEPATKYHFQVRSKGLVGGEAKSVDMTFQTTSDMPIISDLRVLEVNDLDALLSWSTNVPTTTSVSFKDIASGKELTQGDTDFIRDHKFKLEKLSAGRGYSFSVTATDEYGNKAVSRQMALATSKDSSAPVISKVTSTSALYPGKQMNVQTIITWTTDEPATSHVYYQEGLAGDAPQVEIPMDPALVTAHTVVITKFRPMTVYKFHVESTDAAGNLAKSNDFLVLTPQQKASVLDLIIGNFEQVFGWTKGLKM